MCACLRDTVALASSAPSSKTTSLRRTMRWRILRSEVGYRLSPILRTVIDVQDFDGFSFHRVDHDVGERRHRQFSCAASLAGSASVGFCFERADALVNRPYGRFRKVGIVPVEIILDAL